MGLFSRKLWRFLLMFLTCFTSLSVLFSFLYWSPSSSLHMAFDSISSNINQVLLINPSANVFLMLSLETLRSIIRTGVPILVEVIDLVNSVIIFLSQMNLLWLLTFLLGFQTVILIVLLFWIYFFLLMLVFVLRWFSLHLEIVITLLSQFALTFHQIHNGMSRFIT